MTQIDVLKMAIEAGLAAETPDGRHQIWYPDNLHHFANLVAAKEREALAQPEQPAQRTWVGLTDDDELDWEEGGSLKDLVKAIEAKLKEKNT